ncbi:MAG: hypothetical protein J3Q66DRAFT_199534 [Benniella sp.]|nr:MAG: hypothetical protein J3Q66DRAFT_199534 [Benniella sp.]
MSKNRRIQLVFLCLVFESQSFQVLFLGRWRKGVVVRFNDGNLLVNRVDNESARRVCQGKQRSVKDLTKLLIGEDLELDGSSQGRKHASWQGNSRMGREAVFEHLNIQV